jgi:hypothetical protein
MRSEHPVPRLPASALLVVVAIAMLAAAPQTVFGTYRNALLARKTPVNMEFEYTVTRSGPNRIVTERHRVYWTATGVERNDTIEVNGTPVVPAISRMLHRAAWPYDVGQFAVSTDEYDVVPAGVAVVTGRKAYVFIVTRGAPSDFMLKALYVDVKSRLPLRQTFSVAGAGCQGSGSIDFAPTGGYWLPSFVSVVCTAPQQGATPPDIFKESIRFGGYAFPATIPPDVFGIPASPDSSASSGPESP